MRFCHLGVTNFRSIRFAELNNLPGMVLIAGPNGCGKSTLFDAIRLLKSVYGGYQPNEWQQWFSEFQISIDMRRPELLTIFQDPTQPLQIEAGISFAKEEKDYIRDNAQDMLRKYIWAQLVPDQGYMYRPTQAIASQLQQYGPEVDRRTGQQLPNLMSELDYDRIEAHLIIPPDPRQPIQVAPSLLLQVAFSQYDPQHLGILDYHGPQRAYQREQVGGINLNIQTTEQQGSQHALYNYAGKYTNIKTEMASSYVREILGQQAGATASLTESLIATLKELFATFFPGKEFLGIAPTADGRLLFPVRTEGGLRHDINDLSSGEKEVLYGYLRLYSLSPRHSVLLIDEPELHLNPRLVQGLPQFYQKHIGRALDNQIWLLTHSDAMLREALITEDASVFHMLPPGGVVSAENQIRAVQAAEEAEHALIDLVGDLATYKPGAKVVVFEGGGDSEFDIHMVATLFPEFEKSVNAISGGNKARVRNLHALLDAARQRGIFPAKVFSIADRDSDQLESAPDSALLWDVYHIENYLLEPNYILQATHDLLGRSTTMATADEVDSALLSCAREVLPGLILHRLRAEAHESLRSILELGLDPTASDIPASLNEAILRANNKLTELLDGPLSINSIRAGDTQVRASLEADLASGHWKKTFRGRDILKRYAGYHCPGVPYLSFRNIVLSKMRDGGYRPAGMQFVIEQILSA
jgi:hypothetical protein